jgi:hypothetical protein
VPPGEPAEWDRHRRFDESILRPDSGRRIVPPPPPPGNR